mmetsp:Transcript_137097/g.273437  ORF Transcript_137097/g.273437 Transcript_137097/m.273437 type:complete len:117 (+) Transcript_137097:79-429(+)
MHPSGISAVEEAMQPHGTCELYDTLQSTVTAALVFALGFVLFQPRFLRLIPRRGSLPKQHEASQDWTDASAVTTLCAPSAAAGTAASNEFQRAKVMAAHRPQKCQGEFNVFALSND